ncbi:unnamed protein product, partial [Mesorhabditis belari]|uniref:Uncharacterized protein n=1 Tax=Mesorhabditis belari TaxID=2138241 RepID=A0AAF3F727_9BILA
MLLLWVFFSQFVSSAYQPSQEYIDFYASNDYKSFSNKTTKLYDELLTKRAYNKLLSPVYMRSGNSTASFLAFPPLEVFFELEYLKVFALDAQTQLVSLCVQLRMSWLDPRLSWDSHQFGDMQSLYVNADVAWVPDSQFANVKTLDDMIGAEKTLHIASNGIVHMVNVYYVEISCEVEINTFPFDNQTCQLLLMSFSYDGSILSTNGTINQDTVAGQQDDLGNGEWKDDGLDSSSFLFEKRQMLQINLRLKRVPNYYINVIALPCFVITFLSIIGMFWRQNNKSEQLAKLGIGLTSLVSMTVLLDLLSSSIPKTAVFPLLGIYVVGCVGIIAVACVLIMVSSTKDPKKEKETDKEKRIEIEKLLTNSERRWKSIKDALFHPNVCLQIVLHMANLT